MQNTKKNNAARKVEILPLFFSLHALNIFLSSRWFNSWANNNTFNH